MGEIIASYYDKIDEAFGLIGKIRLAQHTKVSSTVAESTPDTPEMVDRFERTYQRLVKEGLDAKFDSK